MVFDAQAIFANLAEKERLRGHHTAEGRAIRTLSRALQGWASGTLGSLDVIAMCDQAIEDWLKAKLKVSAWSPASVRRLLTTAAAAEVLSQREAACLQKTTDLRSHGAVETITREDVNTALLSAIEIIESRW